MQIRQLKIRNFRGIATLDWKLGNPFCCLIGSGDTGKSTILDAIEALLSSRWLSFTENDFLNGNTINAICIEASIGELSKSLKSDDRFGLYIRGWSETDSINDEPEDSDEPILTVRLTVDATMEPVWELVCDRVEDARTLSNRDRSLFGLVKLAGEDTRHLTWGQGSVLSRLTGDTTEASMRLADAYRTARVSAKLDEIRELAEAAELAESFAKGLGAYVEGNYGPGLELGRSGLSSNSIALHDDGVPLRLAGLGTRRLATLAIQKSAISEGAIILIDEIEHGLEPHRIIGAIAQLKSSQTKASEDKKSVGQILMTTHSDVALAEAGAASLRVVQSMRPGRQLSVNKPLSLGPLNMLMRFTPRAFFGRRILVTEGNTEIGMLLGMRVIWQTRHSCIPIEQLGATIVDGNGDQACAMALEIHSLGYSTAIFRDSDSLLSEASKTALTAASIPVFEYGNNLNTEQAIFSAASDTLVQELLDYGRLERGDDAIDNNIDNKVPDLGLDTIRENFATWSLIGSLDATQLREAISEVAARKKWFKDQRIARGLAPIVWRIASDKPSSPLALALGQVETWLYA